MFGIGGYELLIILLFAFLIFGPERLPQAGRIIGRAIRQFKNAQEEMDRVIREEVYDPFKDEEPLKNPFQNMFDDDEEQEKTSPEKSSSDTDAETFAERKARLTLEREKSRLEATQQEVSDTTSVKPSDEKTDGGKGEERGA